MPCRVAATRLSFPVADWEWLGKPPMIGITMDYYALRIAAAPVYRVEPFAINVSVQAPLRFVIPSPIEAECTREYRFGMLALLIRHELFGERAFPQALKDIIKQGRHRPE